MTVKELVSQSERILEPILDLSGKVLYSGVETLVPGELYILGLNPGGKSDPQDDTVRDRLRMLPEKTTNDYIDESWRKAPEGTRPLQRRLRWLVNQLGFDLRDVCASNLIFVRSARASLSRFPEFAKLCWPVHECILRIVRPKVILCFGNSGISPFRFLHEHGIASSNIESIPSGHGSWRCKAFHAEFSGTLTTVVGLPHLSRYEIEGKDHVIQWIASFLRAEQGAGADR